MAAPQSKVTICHVDQETGEKKTITIGTPAAGKHLTNHVGDREGECKLTCQDCFDTLSSTLALCQDFDCFLAGWQDFAECTAICTEDTRLDTAACLNQESGPLATCLESAKDDADIIQCTGDWNVDLDVCSGQT